LNKRFRAAKHAVGGPMNVEELKMNKGLLKEISSLKKKHPEKF
jgi:hypothetical protein